MPINNYFRKFPSIVYDNYVATDIVSGAKIIDKFVNQPYTYYPYEISQDRRADVIAHQYYDDSHLDWLIYYANKTVDPYFGWHQTDTDFAAFIIKKYGSIEAAQKRTIFYRTNWYGDDRTLTETVFEDTIGAFEQKYWDIKYDEILGNLRFYIRKPLDLMVNTNKTVVLNVEFNNSFSPGDLVDIRRNSTNVGTAEVVMSNTSAITLKHIYLTGTNFTYGDIIRSDSNTSIMATILPENETEFANGIIQTSTNITDAENSYWVPVTFFEYEYEKNEELKTIRLIDNRIASQMSSLLTQIMVE